MTLEEEDKLKTIFRDCQALNKKMCLIYNDEIFIVSRIGRAPKPAPGDEPEPSDVAYLDGRGYAALYGCELSNFKILIDL